VTIRSRWIGAGLVLAAAGGLVAATTPATGATAIARDPARSSGARTALPDALCNGGLEGVARIALVPDVLVSEGGRERVEYHGEVAIDRGTSVGVAWQADVVDDRGVRIAQLDTGSFAGRAGNTALSRPLVANLADGFYALRVRAAIDAADEAATVIEAVQHVEIDQGRWIELTDAEWATRSRATEAVTLAELTARGL